MLGERVGKGSKQRPRAGFRLGACYTKSTTCKLRLATLIFDKVAKRNTMLPSHA